MQLKKLSKILSIVLIGFTLILIYPFLLSFFNLNFSILSQNINDFSITLFRTIIYTIACSVLLIILGFLGAVILRSLPFFSLIGKNLGILLLPITLGNISIAFICKLLIGDSAFFSAVVNSSFFYKMFFIAGLQVWQYGLLFIYLYWLSFAEISNNRLEYAKANKFSLFQKIKDVYFPHTKNLTILLLFLGFTFTLFDDSKISYLFKASQGTDSEIITNWLSRNYHSNILVNPKYAENLLFKAGANIFTIVLIVLTALFFIVQLISYSLSKLKAYPLFILKPISGSYKLFAVLLILVAVFPLLLIMFKIKLNIDNSFDVLGFSLLMVLLASLLASAISILFGIVARIGWPNMLNSFNNKSLVFFTILFLLMLVPPIIIIICGYKWMTLIGYHEEWMIQISWIFGHTILSLPVLGSFILFTHFKLSNNELNYLRVFKLNAFEIVKRSFVLRFKAEYLLLFIIAYSSVWNEGVLNSLFSDYIPSFASMIKMLITGSGADYSKAVGFLFVSALVSMLSVIIWRLIIERAHKNFENS